MGTDRDTLQSARSEAADGTGHQPWPELLTRLAARFHRHATISGAIIVILLMANLIRGGGWWTFWPMLALAFLLGLHFLLYKAASVDEAWADERVEDLNAKSYDRGHIESIADRHR